MGSECGHILIQEPLIHVYGVAGKWAHSLWGMLLDKGQHLLFSLCQWNF